MNKFAQVIRSKKYFTIHEYLYGVRSTDSKVYTIDELCRIIKCHSYPGLVWIATIHGTDSTVKKMADNSVLPN